ncbi:Homeobox protein [Klebsormidium nitens]|uniref:Homeobox protein n=1 Tax=Klebsormidium nitens TaxID=105231 RepID=A0A0U9HJH2_KLENI|nr:Homeobox protein [Klebsormidium nitens]|eukprot:GAQ82499.1 Homeobox protein [Klebsormidium nitens]
MATHSAEAHRPGSPTSPLEALPRSASAPQLPSYSTLYAGLPLSIQEDSPLGFSVFDNLPSGSNFNFPPRAPGGNLSPRALGGDLSPRALAGSFSPGALGGNLSTRALPPFPPGGNLSPQALSPFSPGRNLSPQALLPFPPGANLNFSPGALGGSLSPPALSPLSLEALTRSPGQYPEADAIRRHDRYPELVGRLMDCLKVGASENEIRRLDAHRRCLVEESRGRAAGQGASAREPGLDKVMEVTCQQLVALKQQLQQPFDDANAFCSDVERRLAEIGLSRATKKPGKRREKSPSLTPWKGLDLEEEEPAAGPADAGAAGVLALVGAAGPADMGALKARMIALHGPAIARMDIDTWKKEPKARLPAAAIKVMRGWWAKHQDSPYPAENEKQRLAKRAGLELQQVNNWFINERKRHWTKAERRAEPRPAASPKVRAKPRGFAKARKRGAVAQAPRIVLGGHVAHDDGQMVNSTAYMQGRGLQMEGQVYNHL